MRPSFLIRAAIVANALLALARLLSFLDVAHRGEFWRADFPMFYTGFAMVRDGDGAHLYDLDVQLRYQRDIVPERGPDGGLLPFNYPPHAAVPAFVLAYLSRDAAFYSWAAIQLGLTLLLLRQLLSWTSELPTEGRVLLVVTVLAFPPVSISFQMGQVALLALVCLVGLTRALERRRDLPAAGWLVLATIKPQLALVPAVVLVADRRWRALAFAVILFACWASLATWTLGPTVWLDWLSILRRSATEAGELGIFPQAMYNLKGLLFGILGPDRLAIGNRVSFFAFAVGLVLPLLLWLIDPRPSPTIWRLKVALCLQVGFLVNPHFNPADAVVFVLPAVLYLVAAPRDTWSAATAGFLVLCPLLFFLDCFVVGSWPLGVRPFFVAMVALAVRMGWSLGREWE